MTRTTSAFAAALLATAAALAQTASAADLNDDATAHDIGTATLAGYPALKLSSSQGERT